MKTESDHSTWSNNKALYEVNIRQYTEEGTIKAFMEHMPRLRRLNAGILWLMPVNPIGKINRKGSLGSYYSVRNFKAVNPDFGTLEDFVSMVTEAHKLGLKVILDWVANHTAWDHHWAETNPEYYKRDEYGGFISPYDWTDTIALDYNNPATRQAMKDAMKFWVEVADIDGFRCDMAGLVPVEFWIEARAELETVKPMFMLAEDEDNTDLVGMAFDANYSWKRHHLFDSIARGEKNAEDLWRQLGEDQRVFPNAVIRMNFISNHDENSWNGSEFERMGEAVEAMSALAWVIPGIPLIYSGQEVGNTKRLQFFEKDPIEWKSSPFEMHYKKLNLLKSSNKALWNGTEGAPVVRLWNSEPDKVFSFIRTIDNNIVVAAFNLCNHEVAVDIEFGCFSGDFKCFHDNFNSQVLSRRMAFHLKPWQYLIWVG